MNTVEEYTNWAYDVMTRAIPFYSKLEKQGELTKPRQFYLNRTVTVGGSDIGAICGLSKYASALQVFSAKTMRIPPFSGNFNTRLGTALESFIYNELPYMIEGAKILGPKEIFDKEHPWRTAQIDNTAFIPGLGNVNIECKKAMPGKEWGKGSAIIGAGVLDPNGEDDLVPKSYFVQCIWGQAVGLQNDPNAPKVTLLLAFMPFEQKIRIYVIRYDEEMASALLQAADDFVFNNLMADIPPEPTDEEVSDYHRKDVAKDSKEKNVWNDALNVASQLKDVTVQINELKEQQKFLQDEITAHIGDAETVWSDDKTLVASWKTSVTNRFDVTRFKKEFPDEYARFTKESVSRRFSLKI